MTQPDFTDSIRHPPIRHPPTGMKRRLMILIAALYAVFMLVFGVLQIRAGHGLGWIFIGAAIVTVSGYGLEYLLNRRRRRRVSRQGQ